MNIAIIGSIASSGSVDPVNTGSPVLTSNRDVDNPIPGDLLSVTNGTWTLSPTFTYQWSGVGEGDIPGATDSTYIVDVGDSSYQLFCKVTAHDGGGSAEENSNTSGYVILNPPALSASNRLWLRAAAVPGYTSDTPLVDNDPVTNWRDLSYNIGSGYGNRDASQSSSLRPVFKVVSGRPVIRFNGTTQYFDTAIFNLGDNWTGFIVFKPVAPAALGPMLGSNTGIGSDNYLAVNSSLQPREIGSSTATAADPSFAVDPTLYSLLSFTQDNTDFYYRYNCQTNLDTTSAAVLFEYNTIGRSKIATVQTYFEGDIAEIIFYNITLDDATRITVEDYLIQANGLLPNNTVAPTLSGTFMSGNTVTVNDGTWELNVSSLEYQWKLDGVDIMGETTNSYDIVMGDVGGTISCNVRAINVAGYTDVVTAGSLVS